ncbi:hypothetical protein EMIT047CA2_120071 [Pseudomonas soli]
MRGRSPGLHRRPSQPVGWRLPARAQWLCRSFISAYSCGGSRGLYRVPVLARANAREPRTGKATQCLPDGQPPQRLTQARPRDLLTHCVQVPPTGVKRETGASRAL